MRSRVQEAREIAKRAVEMTSADGAEALAVVGSTALTRFAGNRIHQNVAEDNSVVSIRAVLGTRTGVASTNRLDDEGVRACSEAAVRSARSAPEDPQFPGLPLSEPITDGNADSEATAAFDAQARGAAVRSIIDQSESRGLSAAGTVSAASQAVAIANSLGTDSAMASTVARATVLSMGDDGGTGWASFVDKDASVLAAAALGDEAATIAERSANPQDLEPGSYTVVLAPEAVADILAFLAYVGFSAKSVEEGRSFMSGKLGQRLLSSTVSIVDDARSEDTIGLTFDYEGVPKQRVVLVDAGVAGEPVTDSYWAARTGSRNTGHALPAPNSYGPMPLNIAMEPGNSNLDDLISGVERGVYVTRFHYVNVEDPLSVLLTGMTRDGTFMIEAGRLTRPLKNQRFTQSAVAALSRILGVTEERRLVGQDGGVALAPGLLIEEFAFTGQTG